MHRLLRPFTDRATYRRWAHLILGGALLVPYLLLAQVLGALIDTVARPHPVLTWVVAVLVTLAALLATAWVPAVREVETTSARELLGSPLGDQSADEDRSAGTRLRTAAWLFAHVLIGGAISALSLVVPTLAVLGATLSFTAGARPGGLLPPWLMQALPGWTRLPAAVAALLALILLAAGAGALLAALAPALLGPSRTAQLAAAQRRAAELAQRDRLARELHDSVGHALSVVALQANAAGRVLDADPAFARRALTAIAASATTALADLDHALGILRDRPGTAPQADLGQLDRLIADTRAAGVGLRVECSGDLAGLPGAVSREAYRIVQECLTNAVRHAGGLPVTLRLAARSQELEIDVTNPLPTGRRAPRPGGGRGLPGIRERVAVLRGQVTAAPEGDHWRVRVRVPLGAPT